MAVYPVTLLRGPRPSLTDDEREELNPELAGAMPGWMAEFGSPNQVLGLNSAADSGVIRPTTATIPTPYDDAGVAWPADTVLWIGGVAYRGSGSLADPTWRQIGFGSAVTDQLIEFHKNYVCVWIRIMGIPAGSIGTLTITRDTNWFGGAPSITLATYTLGDGTQGDLWIPLDTISAPADNRRYAEIYFTLTWTAGEPAEVWLLGNTTALDPTNGPHALYSARVVPATLPGGYTSTDGAPLYNVGSPLWSLKGPFRVYGVGCPMLSPLMRGFLRSQNTAQASPNDGTVGESGMARRMGLPEGPSLTWTGSGPQSENSQLNAIRPCVFVGDDLKEHSWMPAAQLVDANLGMLARRVTGDRIGAGTQTFGPYLLDQAPGWRAISAWAYSKNDMAGTLTAIELRIRNVVGWGTGSPTVTVATLSWTLAEATGSAGTVKRYTTPIDPASGQVAAVYVDIVLTFSGDAGCTVDFDVRPSRRCDIPPAWPASGPDGTACSGGYLPAYLGNPTEYSATIHGSTGDTVASFGATALNRQLVASFLPATDGIYTAELASSPATAISAGAYECTVLRRPSALARAGKRWWACTGTVSAIAQTITLSKVTDVTTAVPSGVGGLTINSGHLTGSGWCLLTIAAPSAGKWRVSLSGTLLSASTAGTRVLLAASLSDPYCLDTAPANHGEWYGLSILGYQSAPPGSPGNSFYLVQPTGTGAWAGHDNEYARYDSLRAAWQFVAVPTTRVGGLALGGASTLWRQRGETTWRSGSGVLLTLDLYVAAAQTIYLRLGKDDPDGVTSGDSILDCVTSPVVTWAAV